MAVRKRVSSEERVTQSLSWVLAALAWASRPFWLVIARVVQAPNATDRPKNVYFNYCTQENRKLEEEEVGKLKI